MSVTTKGVERDDELQGFALQELHARWTCAKEGVIPDENIKADLPLDKAVTVTFTPKRTGEIRYSCAMGMVGGVLDVR